MNIPVQADHARVEDCDFYHVMDLPGHGTVSSFGSWDLRGRFADYTGSVELAGRSLLDVGTASGFLTFEAEKRGAIVTSFDAESWTQHQHLPHHAAAEAATDVANHWTRMISGYRLAHRSFGSRAKAVYGDIYKLSELVPQHDVVLLGQILVHLRDPLEALRQAALVARDTLIISEGSFEADAPLSVFVGSAESYKSWWHLSVPLYRRWLSVLGFDVARAEKHQYRCNHPALPHDVDVWTFVAHRRARG